MEQIKRFGSSQMGVFTEWTKNKNNYCIYCGDKATTREHIPSKAFLKEPFPDNLPTVPACFKCNNGFSGDEMYVSCYLDILKNSLFPNYLLSEKTTKILLQQPVLRKILEEQIQNDGKTVKFACDYNRLINIIKKLAMGHAVYEFDHVDTCCNPKTCFNFRFQMTNEEIENFWINVPLTIFPELGCRAFQRVSEVYINDKVNILLFLPITVQENQYAYNVFFDEDNKTCVQIMLGDFLFCIVELE